VHVIVERQTVNDGSACRSVVREFSVLLTAAISRVIETIGVGVSTDDGLTWGVDRLIGGENDFMGGETVLMGGEMVLIGCRGYEDIETSSFRCVEEVPIVERIPTLRFRALDGVISEKHA
jgi:hypothetical protein